MAHAQLVCPEIRLRPQHQRFLDPSIEQDLLHAGACFGLCVQSANKDAAASIAELDQVARVQCMYLTHCSIEFDSVRDATLYDPNAAEHVHADVSNDGIISARLTGTGAHYAKLTPSVAGDADVALQNKYDEIENAYRDDGLPDPFDMDANRDELYIVNQGYVKIPVLVYNDKMCIDFRVEEPAVAHRQQLGHIINVKRCNNAAGVGLPGECTTRELYEYSTYVTAAQTVWPKALAPGQPVPLALEKNVCRAFSVRPDANNGNALTLCSRPVQGEEPLTLSAVQSIAFVNQALGMSTYPSSMCLLGGELPFQFVTAEQDPVMQGTVRIAPLNIHIGARHSATVSHDTTVDTDLLAERMSRTGSRNVIGVAMQKITQNTQGDIMLHDGV